jgi:hypothetical protein
MHAAITLRDALDRAPADQRDRIQRAIDQLGSGADQLLDASLPVDVFVDDDGLVRKLAMNFDLPGQSGTGAGSAAITMEMFDFGSDVSIEPPPADQVTDVTSTFSQMTGGLIGH